MTDEAISLLKDFEGLVLKPYKDTVGKTSIGWGRNLDDVGISHEEATAMLTHDIERATAQARRFEWFDGLDAVRQDVVVMMVFNIGIGNFEKFKNLIRAIESKEWNTAAYELFNSLWAKQVQPSRVKAICDAMEHGQW